MIKTRKRKTVTPLAKKYYGKRVLFCGKRGATVMGICLLRDWQTLKKYDSDNWLNSEQVRELVEEGHELEYNYIVALKLDEEIRVIIYEPGTLLIN